jgi:hypothetical protein
MNKLIKYYKYEFGISSNDCENEPDNDYDILPIEV